MKAFLCHSSLDKRYVDIVANRLGRARVEYDTMSFEPMVDFRESIRNSLARSELLVLFASKASLASTWVRYEINSADELVKQGRLRTAVAIIIDDTTAVGDLPGWMRQARVDRVRQPTRAARLISQQLHRLHGLDEQPIFIGRERLMADFAKVLIGSPDSSPPRTILVHGLPGTGRRTFLQHAFKNILSLELGPFFSLEQTDDLDALHASLVSELGELDRRDDLENAIHRFRHATPKARAEELARLVAGLAEPNFAPTIIDSGALLRPDGQYFDSVIPFLQELTAYRDVHLALVHSRKPIIDRERLAAVHGVQFRVPPIEPQATALLLSQSLRRAGISASLSEVNELADYMDGYPPAVYLAISLIKEYGLPTILADKSMLVDFKIRTFSKVLDALNLTEEDWSCLRILASEPALPFEALAAVLGYNPTDMAAQIRRLIDRTLIMPREHVFQIAAPVREAVFVTRGRLTDSEFSRIARALEDAFWQNPAELPPMEIVAATVHAVSRSDATGLSEFGSLVLPSTLYKAAKEKYDEGGPDSWLIALKLTERVLEMDRRHRRARILRFKILVRLGDWNQAQAVLREIAATGDLEQYYLRGFMLWKRRAHEQAIDAFRSALRVGHTAIPVYHGLGTCQLRCGWVDAALTTIREGLKNRRPNKFLLDLGVQAAIEAELYDEAARYLEDLKRFKEDTDFHHRAAILLSAQGDFAEALRHAELAVQGSRSRFEAMANLADILIELREFDRAANQLDSLDARFAVDPTKNDVRAGLRCKLLVREQNWRLAEQILAQTVDQATPHYRALRADILVLKVKDPGVSPGEREAAFREREAIERDLGRRTALVRDFDEAEADETGEDDVEPPSS